MDATLSKEKLLNLLKSDVVGFNEFRRQNPIPERERWDWQGTDLSGANLKGANLRRIDFSRSNFRGADLREAEFTGSILQGATFKGADLTETVFHHCRMSGADLRGGKFTARTSMGRICVSLNSFEGVKWDRAIIEEILDIVNQNSEWLIKYEIVPKPRTK